MPKIGGNRQEKNKETKKCRERETKMREGIEWKNIQLYLNCIRADGQMKHCTSL